MTEPKFTQGDWRIGGFWGDRAIIAQYQVAEKPGVTEQVIANVYGFTDDEANANLHVMAASKALYAACEAALVYDQAIERHASQGKSWVASEDLDRLYQDWQTKATAALAKARGESQEVQS
jgi:hypothetical protein